MELDIKDLHVATVDGKEIVKGVNLKVKSGEFHVIMGPNGSGKTTLAKAIMGHPGFKITKGNIFVDGKSITSLTPDKRAKLGLFLQFQNPVEIEGVGFVNFLRAARESITDNTVDIKQFMGEVRSYTEKLAITNGIVGRTLNHGFSGGEKKKGEILQMAVLRPAISILDEPDSGLDIDAIKVVASNVNDIMKDHGMGAIVITHYSRILSYMKPQRVHVMHDGKIVAEGGKELILKLEKDGYESVIKDKE
ncbi:MAG: Fe-S cluster assembly ATPase SufC [Candidatus Marsarchaeota archaeon]|nr:Fe-S cluster assembly ATPase SufC [Candidatus Marsarchaeota archaeon]